MKKGVIYVDWLTEIYNIGHKHGNKQEKTRLELKEMMIIA